MPPQNFNIIPGAAAFPRKERLHHRGKLAPNGIGRPHGPSLVHPRSGFSLVEVTMAIGILSFVLLPLMGMLAVGLGIFRDSKAQTMDSMMRQSVISDALMADFTEYTSQAQRSYYFTEEGEPTTDQVAALWRLDCSTAPPPDEIGSGNASALIISTIHVPSGKTYSTNATILVRQ